jgi:hypothetical protein
MTNATPSKPGIISRFFTWIKRLFFPIPKPKRDILRFNGPTTSKAIDLGKCLTIDLVRPEKKVYFYFEKEKPDFIEMDNEGAAASAYEAIVSMWAGERA